MLATLLRTALLAVAGLSRAAAQDVSPEIVRAQAGTWLVVSDDGRPGCRVTLEVGSTIGGRVAKAEPVCRDRIPQLADLSSWSFAENGISLNDPTRRSVMLFREDETTLLKTVGDGAPTYLMVQARPGVDRAPHAPAIFGSWTMQRPNGPAICTVSLASKPPPGGEESFALTLDPRCDPAVRRLQLASWRVEDFALVLYGQDGASLRFEPLAEGAFTKAASEGGLPLRLVRAK